MSNTALTEEEILSINNMLQNAVENASVKGASEWVAVTRTMPDGSRAEITVAVVKREGDVATED